MIIYKEIYSFIGIIYKCLIRKDSIMKEWMTEFKEIKLFSYTEDEKQIMSDFEELDRIFTSNLAGSAEQAKGLYMTYQNQPIIGKENYQAIPFAIRDKQIRVYKYILERPKEPTQEEMQQLREQYRFKVERTGLLYWWAKCYATSRKIELEPYYNSFLVIDHTIPLRCGQITGDMLFNLMLDMNKDNKAIIFPFVDFKGESKHKEIQRIPIYMIEFRDEYLSVLRGKKLKIIEESISRLSFIH